MNATEQRRAWRQALLSVLVFSGIAVVFAAIRAQPDGADEVKIPLAALRSSAGELLLWRGVRPSLPAVFNSAFGKQQLTSIVSTRDNIEKLRPENRTLGMLRSELREHSAALVDAAGAIAHGSTASSAAPGSLPGLQQRLQRAEASLANVRSQ
jgi:hypothetical protein